MSKITLAGRRSLFSIYSIMTEMNTATCMER